MAGPHSPLTLLPAPVRRCRICQSPLTDRYRSVCTSCSIDDVLAHRGILAAENGRRGTRAWVEMNRKDRAA